MFEQSRDSCSVLSLDVIELIKMTGNDRITPLLVNDVINTSRKLSGACFYSMKRLTKR